MSLADSQAAVPQHGAAASASSRFCVALYLVLFSSLSLWRCAPRYLYDVVGVSRNALLP